VIIAIVNWFRPEIRAILSRIRKGKFLGQEIELDELQAKTVAAEVKAELLTTPSELSARGVAELLGLGLHPENRTRDSIGDNKLEGGATVGPDLGQDAIEEVLREAARSPKLGLMLLSTKIDRAARELVDEADIGIPLGPLPLSRMIDALVRAGQFSSEGGEALALFTAVRNRIVHGQDADDDEIARAIDFGTRLLKLLLSKRQLPQASDVPHD